MLLTESLPELSVELIRLLVAANESALAEQVASLSIVERCSCGGSHCSSFYTAPKPVGAYGPGHRNVLLEPDHGMIILDVVAERIMQIEILDRDDVFTRMQKILP